MASIFPILTNNYAKRIYITKLDTYLYNTLKSFSVETSFPSKMVSTRKILQENDAILSSLFLKTISMLRLFFIFYSNDLDYLLRAVNLSKLGKFLNQLKKKRHT